MTIALTFSIAGTAQAYQRKFTPYFRNSDVWVGDVHMNVLASNRESKMIAYARAHGSYCKASQDGIYVHEYSGVNQQCGAIRTTPTIINSSGDYAYYATR